MADARERSSCVAQTALQGNEEFCAQPLPEEPNLLKQNFTSAAPNQAWICPKPSLARLRVYYSPGPPHSDII